VPTYRPFFEAMHAAATLTIAPGEVYTALERGVIDGFGWPLTGLFDRSLQEQVKYRVEPGFYSNNIGVLINLNAWNKLNEQQKDVLNKAAVWMEGLSIAENPALFAKEKQRHAEAGIQTIAMSEADAREFTKLAYDTAWATIIKNSPQDGPKLRELLTK
jgi:TRAP-type C4-dicarboxylate transport system substrate-binding protein